GTGEIGPRTGNAVPPPAAGWRGTGGAPAVGNARPPGRKPGPEPEPDSGPGTGPTEPNGSAEAGPGCRPGRCPPPPSLVIQPQRNRRPALVSLAARRNRRSASAASMRAAGSLRSRPLSTQRSEPALRGGSISSEASAVSVAIAFGRSKGARPSTA